MVQKMAIASPVLVFQGLEMFFFSTYKASRGLMPFLQRGHEALKFICGE